MQEEIVDERRHSRRVMTGSLELAMMPFDVSVQVIDVSAKGMLFHAPRAVPLGARGRLRLNLAGLPFNAEVEVQRVSPVPQDSGTYWIGVTFVAPDPGHQQMIERFVSQ